MQQRATGVRRAIPSVSARLALTVALGLACGSGADSSGSQATPAPATTPAPPTSTPPSSTPPLTPLPDSTTPSTPEPGTNGSEAPGDPALEPTAVTGQAATVNQACDAFSGTDACADCVCERCSSELGRCAETPGCAEILACVREAACSGRECFCGDAGLTECLRGESNGPCKEVVLAAPESREPSLDDPSAGPASDAALAVGDCADSDDECGELCELER